MTTCRVVVDAIACGIALLTCPAWAGVDGSLPATVLPPGTREGDTLILTLTRVSDTPEEAREALTGNEHWREVSP